MASTWNASRAPPLPMSISSRLRRFPSRESATEGRKNASSTSVNGTAPLAYVSAPTTKAAPAPLADSARARHAPSASAPANTAPISRSRPFTCASP